MPWCLPEHQKYVKKMNFGLFLVILSYCFTCFRGSGTGGFFRTSSFRKSSLGRAREQCLRIPVLFKVYPDPPM